YDIVMIQEPHIDHLSLSRASPHWHVLYPTDHLNQADKSRSLTLINKKYSTNDWTQLPVKCPDVTAVRLHGDFGFVQIFNIYNDGQHNQSMDVIE
ncbi:hypothetical protein PLICRDRAFT_79777, partial [Plicaturopsis crispa FD-325 SS-3]